MLVKFSKNTCFNTLFEKKFGPSAQKLTSTKRTSSSLLVHSEKIKYLKLADISMIRSIINLAQKFKAAAAPGTKWVMLCTNVRERNTLIYLHMNVKIPSPVHLMKLEVDHLQPLISKLTIYGTLAEWVEELWWNLQVRSLQYAISKYY